MCCTSVCHSGLKGKTKEIGGGPKCKVSKQQTKYQQKTKYKSNSHQESKSKNIPNRRLEAHEEKWEEQQTNRSIKELGTQGTSHQQRQKQTESMNRQTTEGRQRLYAQTLTTRQGTGEVEQQVRITKGNHRESESQSEYFIDPRRRNC